MNTRINNTMQKEKGFTLVELLAVSFILVMVSGIIATLLYSVLRSSNRVGVVGLVAQNGNYALSVATSLMRNSQGLVAPNTCPPSPTPALTTDSITVRGFDGADTTLHCTGSTIASESASTSISLLDTSTVELDTTATGTPCSSMFVCSQQRSLPTVTVQFTLKNKGTESFIENRYSAFFKTTVFFRNALIQ